MMDKLFDNFYNYAGFGPAIDPIIPSDSFCDEFKGKLPDQLMEYWKEYGISGWGEGIFWTVNPLDYTEVLEAWLAGTPFEGKDEYYVIARSAFGELYIWGTNSGNSLDIITPYGKFFPNETEKQHLERRGGDQSIRLFFASQQIDSQDMDDVSDTPLFQRAKEKLGPLAHDEMYGFVPVFALGGQAELKNLQKVKIIEHLAFLADVGEKYIMHDINKILGSTS
jgi:hypothetical protein